MRRPHHIAAKRARLEREIKRFTDLISQSPEPVTPQQKRVLTIRQRVLSRRKQDLAKLPD